MRNDHTFVQSMQESFNNALEEVLREGARKLLKEAIELEIAEYIASHAEEKGENGRRLVTRNGYLPERSLQTGMGPIEVRQPRIRDRRGGARFSSSILPPYARRTPSVETVIPSLYLKGVSTGDFPEALAALLGSEARELSLTLSDSNKSGRRSAGCFEGL